MTTTLIDILTDLTNAINSNNNKIDILTSTFKDIQLEFSAVKASSEFTETKLKQVEACMESMNIPAYTEAILNLAQNVNFVLNSPKLNDNEGALETTTQRSDSAGHSMPRSVSNDQVLDIEDRDKVEPSSSVIIFTDIDMSKDHTVYVEQQLGLSSVSVNRTPSPFTSWGLEELKYKMAEIAVSDAILFSFSTMTLT